ncbi:hypothetical protein Hdeb2414_s0007g00250361 [Helianthus debilis subsp. tardiflorus]
MVFLGDPTLTTTPVNPHTYPLRLRAVRRPTTTTTVWWWHDDTTKIERREAVEANGGGGCLLTTTTADGVAVSDDTKNGGDGGDTGGGVFVSGFRQVFRVLFGLVDSFWSWLGFRRLWFRQRQSGDVFGWFSHWSSSGSTGSDFQFRVRVNTGAPRVSRFGSVRVNSVKPGQHSELTRSTQPVNSVDSVNSVSLLDKPTREFW